MFGGGRVKGPFVGKDRKGVGGLGRESQPDLTVVPVVGVDNRYNR